MKERPILFSGPMVRAILDGRKTQTRRVLKIQPPTDFDIPIFDGSGYGFFADIPDENYMDNWPDSDSPIICPYGKPGDRLWVRETWATTTNVLGDSDWPLRPCVAIEWDEDEPAVPECATIFRADGEWPWIDDCGVPAELENGKPQSFWKPSIFMPRWASRITLEITNVRVERLQEISGAECDSEGIVPGNDPNWGRGLAGVHDEIRVIRAAFAEAWDKINGKKHPWDSNPWVWVIEFQTVNSTN